jgi:hypothetical protein
MLTLAIRFIRKRGGNVAAVTRIPAFEIVVGHVCQPLPNYGLDILIDDV